LPTSRLLGFVATDKIINNRMSEPFELVVDIRSAWKLVQSRRFQSRGIRQTDVIRKRVQGVSRDLSFVIRHSGKQEARGPA
jgi:hypothetical protein